MKKSFKERLQSSYNADLKGCWNWTKSKTKQGYGRMWYRGSLWSAHRVSYSEYVSEIPEGMQVLHECDNPSCINPKHLFLGNNDINVADKMAKGRHRSNPKGVANSSAKLNPEKAFEIRWLAASGWSRSKLGRAYGVTKQNINAIVHNKIWQMECHD